MQRIFNLDITLCEIGSQNVYHKRQYKSTGRRRNLIRCVVFLKSFSIAKVCLMSRILPFNLSSKTLDNNILRCQLTYLIIS